MESGDTLKTKDGNKRKSLKPPTHNSGKKLRPKQLIQVKQISESFDRASPKTPTSAHKEPEVKVDGIIEYGITKLFESVNKLRRGRTL
jgi:hypothetical protein